MPDNPVKPAWNASRIAKEAKRNRIQDRGHMAERIGLGVSTIHEAFTTRKDLPAGTDWTGQATLTVLTRMAATFGVRSSDLIVEPWIRRARAKAAS